MVGLRSVKRVSEASRLHGFGLPYMQDTSTTTPGQPRSTRYEEAAIVLRSIQLTHTPTHIAKGTGDEIMMTRVYYMTVCACILLASMF